MRWSSWFKRGLLVAVGAGIGWNGVVVAVTPGRIPATYGIVADGPDLAVLLRHRAVMLALLGSVLVASAFQPRLRPAAVPAAALGMATFVWFALTADVGDAQHRIAVADVVLLVLLGLAVAVPERREPGPRSAARS